MTATEDASTDERPYSNWAKYRSEWWKRYFSDELAHFWPPTLDQLEIDDNGYRWISRDDVFRIAADESEHRELHTAVAAYVWGLGKNAYSIGRMVRAFTANAETVEDNLRKAAALQASEGTVAAYEALRQGGALNTKHMGPAYFTKFLFFVGGRNPAGDGLRPLVLDSRVATALRARGIFGSKVGSGDWSSELYRRFLVYCQEQNPHDPEAVEAELFTEGRATG